MKTTKGGKVMNPTDAYRKELRKKELKRVTFLYLYLCLLFSFFLYFNPLFICLKLVDISSRGFIFT